MNHHCVYALLFWLVLSPFPAAQPCKVPCESNIYRGLRDMGVDPHHLELIHPAADNHAIFVKDKDGAIWELVHTPGWSQDQAVFIDKIFHGKSTDMSFRHVGRPSMQCTRHNTPDGIVWELDYDKWEPSKLSNLTAHFFLEVLPHALLHTATSQTDIQHMLDRQERQEGHVLLSRR
jgi:YD repeat-containing protein